jgi:hypothetical protein
MGSIVLNTFEVGRESAALDYLRGAASAFNLRGSTRGEYHFHENDSADAAAVQNDWEAIAHDLETAFAAALR